MSFEHFVSASCGGEKCGMCYAPATHKVAEVIMHDDKPNRFRHEFTQYVCCQCFGRIFGMVAVNWCQTGDMLPTVPPMDKGSDAWHLPEPI
jgi:hypothetical protein